MLGNNIIFVSKINRNDKNELLSCVIGVIILSLLVGAYFYQRNKMGIHKQAERLFVQMLQEEMERKERDLNLFHLFAESSSDTLPLKICITTAEGKKRTRLIL